MYRTVETMEHTIEALCNNNLFSLTFERMQRIVSDKISDVKELSDGERDRIIRGIIENVPFEEVYEWILEADYLDDSFLGGDIVQCMFPKYNKKPEDLTKIYSVVNFQAHGDEKPVFFVDTSLTSSRTNGLLVTTKGLYRKSKGMISLTAKMPVEVDQTMKEINVKNTCILSFNGPRAEFEDIVELFQVVYIFNTMRYKDGEEIDVYVNPFSVDEHGNLKYNEEIGREQRKKRESSDELNDSGLGQSSKPSTVIGVIIWIIIIVIILKRCGA
jgi:hypothetical protein